MSLFFPHIYWVLLGLLGSVAVNVIADALSIRRELVSEAFSVEFYTRSYWRGLFLPWSFSIAPIYWRSRVLLVHALMLGASFVLAFLGLPEVPFWWGYPLFIYLAIVTVMDIEHRVILHPVSVAGALIGVLLGSHLHGVVSTLVGGIFGFGAMYLIYLLGGWLLNRMKRWQGEDPEESVPLGFGDVNLSGVMGLLLGWPGVWAGFVLMLVAGGLLGGLFLLLMLALRRYRPDLAMPYGPFIVFAILTLLYFRSFY